MPFIMVLSEL